MPEPTSITINPDGFPSEPIDLLCIYTALATVPGHRIQDNRLATNVILKDVHTELYTHEQDHMRYNIGSYVFIFNRAPSTNVL